VMAGLHPVWVRPEVDPATGLPGGVPVQTVRDALAAHPDACGVILGDPSYVGTIGDLAGCARAAHEAGVTVLAGTDTHPCGTIAQEVERLISAGLPRAAALGAACWTARSWLGLPGLVDGAPADLVVFAEDPVAHPDVLHHPSRIILRGQVVT